MTIHWGFILSNLLAAVVTAAVVLSITRRDLVKAYRSRMETSVAVYWAYLVDLAWTTHRCIRPKVRGVAGELGSDWRAKFEDRRPRHRQPVSRWAAVKSR